MTKPSGEGFSRGFAMVVFSTVLASCAAVGPDYEQPAAPLPDSWDSARNAGLKATQYELIEWWEVFSDPTLNRLVEVAHEQNYNLELAGLRVLEARAQLGIAVGSQYPQQQFISGDVTRVGPSENAGQGDTSFNRYDLSASLAWEMDFWGKFRRGIESADAALQASVANYDEAMVLITAQVVSTYVTIRTLEEQLRISRENLKLQQRSYDIATVLYKNGQDSELDVQQARSLLLNTKATVPSLQAQVNLSRNAMDTLLGQTNGYSETIITAGPIPDVPQQIAVGIPADLMRRRPDLRQAELQAVAQNAQVGVATADLYPSIALNGSLGVFSISRDVGGGGGSNLFESDSMGYTAGASFSWPVLNYGRIRNNVRVQDARLQQAIVSYQELALEAAQEVDDAMESLAGAQAQKEILIDAVESSRRSNQLSTLRYKEGFSDYQRVLDSQQSLITSQNRYVTAQGQAVQERSGPLQGTGWRLGNTRRPAVRGRKHVDRDARKDQLGRTFG